MKKKYSYIIIVSILIVSVIINMFFVNSYFNNNHNTNRYIKYNVSGNCKVLANIAGNFNNDLFNAGTDLCKSKIIKKYYWEFYSINESMRKLYLLNPNFYIDINVFLEYLYDIPTRITYEGLNDVDKKYLKEILTLFMKLNKPLSYYTIEEDNNLELNSEIKNIFLDVENISKNV